MTANLYRHQGHTARVTKTPSREEKETADVLGKVALEIEKTRG